MELSLIVLIATPLVAGLLSLGTRTRRSMEWLQGTHAAVLLAAMVVVVMQVAAGSIVTVGILLRADALSAFLDLMLAFVGGTCLLYALGYMGEEVTRGHVLHRRYKQFFCLFNLYLFAMLLAANVDNIALMWIAIEGSTLSAALLIGFEKTKAALEAGWKYIILSFVGIALALFGTVLVYYASEHVLGVSMEALSWEELYRVAAGLNPTALKLAFVFVLIGYGTKAGVAPMHTWLPDAHGEAPTPVSAMLSGLMLNLALYAVLRFKSLVDRTVGEDFTGPILLVLGLLSVAIAAIFLLVQRDYKRLFAYSSIEHVGITLVGFGIGGPMGVFGGLFHMLNHALAKSTAFYAAGMVVLRCGHKAIERVTGLVRQMPLAGGSMVLAALALAGMPPFGLFVSEVLIATETYGQRQGVAFAFLGLLAVAFATLLYQVFRMALGEPTAEVIPVTDWTRRFTTSALVINLAAMGYAGTHMPEVLRDLFLLMTGLFGVAAEIP
ncbi:MAG: hydrogenase 4 subunit F [Nitrospirae bacterium]|nr:MAG: hydrogenase 4 subunit F [Nitrospirota bacterium]